jgi:hypothetical protein
MGVSVAAAAIVSVISREIEVREEGFRGWKIAGQI